MPSGPEKLASQIQPPSAGACSWEPNRGISQPVQCLPTPDADELIERLVEQ